jgi:hypothetical protein
MIFVTSAPIIFLIILYFRKFEIFRTMGEHTLDWLREKAIGWSHTPPINKIDTHHHFVPDFYAKGKILATLDILIPH